MANPNSYNPIEGSDKIPKAIWKSAAIYNPIDFFKYTLMLALNHTATMTTSVIQESQDYTLIPYLLTIFIDCYNIAPLIHGMSFTRSFIININLINNLGIR